MQSINQTSQSINQSIKMIYLALKNVIAFINGFKEKICIPDTEQRREADS